MIYTIPHLLLSVILIHKGLHTPVAAQRPDPNDKEASKCSLSPSPGPCKAAIQRWFFDGRTCQEFDWGGCGGVVPFESEDDCISQCSSRNARTVCDGVRCPDDQVCIDTPKDCAADARECTQFTCIDVPQRPTRLSVCSRVRCPSGQACQEKDCSLSTGRCTSFHCVDASADDNKKVKDQNDDGSEKENACSGSSCAKGEYCVEVPRTCTTDSSCPQYKCLPPAASCKDDPCGEEEICVDSQVLIQCFVPPCPQYTCINIGRMPTPGTHPDLNIDETPTGDPSEGNPSTGNNQSTSGGSTGNPSASISVGLHCSDTSCPDSHKCVDVERECGGAFEGMPCPQYNCVPKSV